MHQGKLLQYSNSASRSAGTSNYTYVQTNASPPPELTQLLQRAGQLTDPAPQIASQLKTEDAIMSNLTREEVNACIRASEATTETKIVRLEGKLDTMAATIVGKIDSLRDDISNADKYNRDTRWVLIGTLITGLFALAGLILALATYGDALFSRGMNVRDVVQTLLKEQQEIQRGDTNLPQPNAPTPNSRRQ